MISKRYFSAIDKIITMGHWVTDSVNKEVKVLGMTEPQYNVLRTLDLAKGQPISVNSIRRNMVQRSSNVTRIIDRLLSKGFVDRHECPSNRRKMDITITKEGQAILNKMDKKVFAFHRSMIKNLGAEELDQLLQLMTKLKGENND